MILDSALFVLHFCFCPVLEQPVKFSGKIDLARRIFDAFFQEILVFPSVKIWLGNCLCKTMSSSFDSINKLTSLLEHGGAGHAHEAKTDPVRHISSVVAHELNNQFTIIQGYSERLLLKHGGDPATVAHLKLIIEASRCAAGIVRTAKPPTATVQEPKENLQPSEQPPA